MSATFTEMYQIARAAGQSRERRRLATHPAKVKPELMATGPTQVWSCYAEVLVMPISVPAARAPGVLWARLSA